jgi:hypothetical protein
VAHARPAERTLTHALSRLVPGAIGLLACAVLPTGSIAAADQRRAEAREREAAAVQRFRELFGS